MKSCICIVVGVVVTVKVYRLAVHAAVNTFTTSRLLGFCGTKIV